MLSRARRRPDTKKRVIGILLVTVCLTSFGVFWFESLINNIQNTIAETKAPTIAENIVSSAVNDTLSSPDLDKDFVKVQYNADGSVAAVTTNASAINSFKARLESCLQGEIDRVYTTTTKIPLGTFSGINAISSYGPKVEFSYTMTASFKTDIKSYFTDGGINQTVHHLELTVQADFILLCLGHDTAMPFTTNYEISQTVVVGTVPETYVVGNDFTRN